MEEMKLSCKSAIAIILGLSTLPSHAQTATDAEVLNVPQAWETEEITAPTAEEEQLQADAEVEFSHYLEVSEGGEEAIESATESTIIDKKIASWLDPLTLPKSRMECVKWAYPWPGAKICVGHKYQFQWMYCEARLVVTGPSIDGVGGAVNDCLQTGAAVAAVAGIVAAAGTGGAALPAAKAAFLTTFEGCVAAKVGSEALGVNVAQNCSWGPWE
ncbi:hypothetical protein [Paracoccus niistensis]|uniref:Uncharacterized protein n=1 Tax=Paracoccus niistensis TaxID=632935 RepID=A0ABV6I8L2_9RHOB